MHRLSAFGISGLLLVAGCAPPLLAQSSVRSVRVFDSPNAVEIQVESSANVTPQTRVLSGPDRLVVDFPNATPGLSLRSQSIDQGEVRDLRIGLFQSKPPITRIVLDLKSAQSYQVLPNGRTVIIKVAERGGDALAEASAPAHATRPGLIAATYTASAEPIPVPVERPLEVWFSHGLLKIHANKATLSEVLTAVQQRTGADISQTAGTEQEKVVVDLGPAPAPQVLDQLLHGSRFNFLILSAANDPNQLDRLILTPRADGATMPLAPLQANNIPAQEDSVATEPPQPFNPPQQPEVEANPPQAQPQQPVPATGANPGNDPPDQ
jgi:hypothetical protein